jgi:hypothetical protein
MPLFNKLAFGILLLISPVLTGCEDTPCDPCEGEVCESFRGEYYGTIESLNETCADVYLVTGDEYANVISINPFSLESRDSRGLWAVLNGSLCATTDEADPMNYPFTAYYSPDTTGEDYKLYYSLIGFFTAGYQEGENVYPTSVTATLDLRFVFDDGEVCTLMGDIRLTQSL